jgi:hypothetical protein
LAGLNAKNCTPGHDGCLKTCTKHTKKYIFFPFNQNYQFVLVNFGSAGQNLAGVITMKGHIYDLKFRIEDSVNMWFNEYKRGDMRKYLLQFLEKQIISFKF